MKTVCTASKTARQWIQESVLCLYKKETSYAASFDTLENVFSWISLKNIANFLVSESLQIS